VGEIVLSDDNIIPPYVFAVFVGLSGAILVCLRGLSVPFTRILDYKLMISREANVKFGHT